MFFVAFGNPAPIVSGTSELSWKCSAVKKKMTIVRCSFSKVPNLELHPWAHSEAIAMVTESSDTDSLPGMIV